MNMQENSSQSRNEAMDVYKTIFDTWRSQVDSSWQRSSYFAVFETAAIGGAWLLVGDRRLLSVGAGVGVSVGGFLLTVIWYLSTKKTHEYVRHWWDSIRKIEARLGLAPYDYAGQLESERGQAHGVRYRTLLFGIPFLFGLAWVGLFLIAIMRVIWLAGVFPCK